MINFECKCLKRIDLLVQLWHINMKRKIYLLYFSTYTLMQIFMWTNANKINYKTHRKYKSISALYQKFYITHKFHRYIQFDWFQTYQNIMHLKIICFNLF